MRVMVMVKAAPSSEAGLLPDEKILTEMGQFNEELIQAGIMQAGEGLHPSSKRVRVLFSGTDRTVTDGPFTETKELVAGYWIWKVKSMEEAIDWVKRCPNPMQEDSEIEIRPIFEADEFGESFTPELREQEAIQRAQMMGLGKPEIVEETGKIIAGQQEHYTCETRQNIAAQWEKFAPQLGHIPGQVGMNSYGVCFHNQPDGHFDYISGVEVSDTTALPESFSYIELQPQRYLVFLHTEHVSLVDQTLDKIWTEWLPTSGLKPPEAPCFERYTPKFNPQTGLGGVELWIPLTV